MKIKRCDVFNDVLIIEKKMCVDERGCFSESFKQCDFDRMFLQYPMHFVQDNVSFNPNKYTLRGLHFQYPRAQGKYINVMGGDVNTVIVDLRVGSRTRGQWNRYRLNNETSLYVPEGFAHGFITLSDNVFYYYKNTRYYHPDDCEIIQWDDDDLNIDWGVDDHILKNRSHISEADKNGDCFKVFYLRNLKFQ